MNKNHALYWIGFAGFISAADNWVASLLLPDIAATFATTVAKTSVILTAYLLPYGIMQPLYGYYSDKYPRKTVLQLLMLMLCVATLCCALASNLAWLTIFRFLAGFFAAGIITVSLGTLGELYSPQRLSKIIGLFFGSVFLGQGLSAGLGGWLLELGGWRSIFIIFSVLSLISCGLLYCLPSTATSSARSSLGASLCSLLRNKRLLAIYLLACCNGATVLGGYSFMGAYLSSAFGLPHTWIGIGLMLFGLVCFCAGMINTFLAKHFSAPQLLVAGFSCSLCAFACLIAHRCPLAFLALFLLGMAYVLIQSVLASRALTMTQENKGLSSGLVGVGVFGGGGLGTWGGSFILEQQGYLFLFSCFAVLSCLIILANIKYAHRIFN